MKSNYDILGKHIRLIDNRNTDSVTDRVLGISIDKSFMPSVANFDLEQIDYDNSNYELDIWSSCFNPIFSPPPEVIKEWDHQFDDWDEPEPTLENTSVYFTEDGANYLIVGKTIIPVSEHFAETGKTVNEVIEDVIRYAVKSQKK